MGSPFGRSHRVQLASLVEEITQN